MTMGWMSQYRGRSCGRVLYGLEVFCESNHRLFEVACVSGSFVEVHGKVIATYTWPDDPADDKPLFEFLEFEGLAARFTESQFQRRPYMDDRQVMQGLSYTIQEVRNCLTFPEALHIRHIRDYKGDMWDMFPEPLKRKICAKLPASSYGYITTENVDWKHIALCAIYSI